MNEVQPRAVDRRGELAQAVELGLPSSPVEPVPPVVGETLQVGETGPRGPRRERRLVGPARARKALSEISDVCVGDVQAEGLWGCRGHGPSHRAEFGTILAYHARPCSCDRACPDPQSARGIAALDGAAFAPSATGRGA